jgi:hypothetical protein
MIEYRRGTATRTKARGSVVRSFRRPIFFSKIFFEWIQSGQPGIS